MSAGSIVTITGLAGSATPSSGTFPTASTDDILGTSGNWTDTGELKLTVAEGSSFEQSTNYVVVFLLKNPTEGQVSPSVSIEATIKDNNVTVGSIASGAMTKSATVMYGVSNGTDPLTVVVSVFSVKTIQ